MESYLLLHLWILHHGIFFVVVLWFAFSVIHLFISFLQLCVEQNSLLKIVLFGYNKN